MTQAQIRAMHASGQSTLQPPPEPAPVVLPPGRVAAAAKPPPKVERTAPPDQPMQAAAPVELDTLAMEDVDALGDALVLLAMSTGGDDLAVRQAAIEVSRRRSVPIDHAMRIVQAAKLQMTIVGRKRKALDPDTAAALIGETRARMMAIFKTGMSKDNFGKGGAGAAVKAAQAIALIDGCPVDGMVQIVGHITHEHDHEHHVQDPERTAIVEALLRRARPSRVIEVAADG